jgi:polyhydroxybutyrate depolymerase
MGRRLRRGCTLLAVFAVVAAFGAPTAQAAEPCSLEPTNGTETRVLGGRTYELYVPSGLAGPSVPLLVTMHGFTSFGLAHAYDTGWREFAASHGFIVAFPNGIANAWSFREGSYDVTFLRDVAADVSARWCVDPRRVHASGHSNGAIMAQRLACDAGDVFASVTEYAGNSPDRFGSQCRPGRAIGVGLFQGDSDPLVSQASAEASRDEWVARNGCSTTPVSESPPEGVLLRYTGCDGGVEVLWRLYSGQGHLWPKGARGEDMRSRMWAFLTAHPLP